jgi:type II secretory pathway pseudopilin PulG
MKKENSSNLAAAVALNTRFGKSGFIMVETLVSVTIILVAIPAILGMAIKGITLGVNAKNQMIATYLAEEPIEQVRARRDFNLMNIEANPTGTTDWDDGFSNPGEKCKAKGCIINPLASDINQVITTAGGNFDTTPPPQEFRLYLDANGIYSPVAGGTPSPFYRVTYVQKTTGPWGGDIYTITTQVKWQTGFAEKMISVTGLVSRWLQ